MDSSKTDTYSDAPEVIKTDASQAPEVVTSYKHADGADGLQAVQRPAIEGLQAVDARPHYSNWPAYSPPNGYHDVDEKAYAGHAMLDGGVGSGGRFAGKKRRKWIFGGSIAVVLIIIAVAVGVGVGVTQSNSSGGNNGNLQSAQAPTTTTPSTTTSSTASSTSSAITSGATGLAQFSCEAGGTITSEEDVDYTQACFLQYQTGGEDFYDSSETIENVGGAFQKYTFRDCIDTCDQYNIDRDTGDLPCKAVTYYANVTVPIDLYAGNCFLKTGRGVAYTGDPFDYTHTASAYWSCLDDTTCIE